MTKAKFKSQERPGFQMTFENGWTISVQWHTGAYCDGYRRIFSHEIDNKPAESRNAEIALWNSEGEWYNFGNDTVLGHQTPDQVAEWISKTKSF